MVPQKFTKIKIVDEELENEEFVVKGRKIALSEITKNLLEKHNKFLQIQNDLQQHHPRRSYWRAEKNK